MSLNYKQALELAREGEWDSAHQMVQPFSDTLPCLIHGYLHRLEGDLGNADYWYRRAGENRPDNSLDEEWLRLYERVG